jgi:hypothetical protein
MKLSLSIMGIGIVAASTALVGDAHALGPYTCNVVQVGFRTDVNALKIACSQGTIFWAPEASANPTCGTKTSWQAMQMFLTTANASLLSGKSVTIYWNQQTGCNQADAAPREIYLNNW